MGMWFKKNKRVVHVSSGSTFLGGPVAVGVGYAGRCLGLTDTVAFVTGCAAGLAVMVLMSVMVVRQYRKRGYEEA